MRAIIPLPTQVLSHGVKICLCLLLSCTSLLGISYHLELPEYKANVGQPVSVPVTLHDATGLAHICVQINYDSEVLAFESVRSGRLGELFEMTNSDSLGTLQLNFVRAEDLDSGAGDLAYIRFTTNSGATTDLYSDLAIAKFEIGDSSGVTDLTVENTIILENGSVYVSADRNLDNANNGLPDWWEEENELDLFSSSGINDEDGDSIVNKLELAFGGDPNAPDSPSILPFGALTIFDSKGYFTLKFRRRSDESDGFTFQLYESTNLVDWEPRSISDLTVQTVDLGDGMELISVRGSNPMTGPEGEPKCFLRLKID